MSLDALTRAEFGALMEVGTGFAHDQIQHQDAVRLIHLGLIYSLLGSHRITTAGRTRLSAGI